MGGGQEPPDKKQELIEQLRSAGIYTNAEVAADFILKNFTPKAPSSVFRQENVQREPHPPLDAEELEKQIQAIVNHAKWNVGFVPDPESSKWQDNVKFETKEILALFAQHTQVAVKAELKHIDPNSDYVMKDLVMAVGDRLEQLEQRKKEK